MKEIEIDKKLLLSKLKISKIFKLLTDNELDDLLSISEVLEFDKHEEIIKEGEISPFLYVILTGSVNVIVKQNHENNLKDVYICTIGEGDVFGEAAIFLNVKRTAYVISNDTLQSIRIKRQNLIDFIKKHPSAGIKILMVIIYSLLHKLRGINQELAFERQAYVAQDDIDNLINDFFNDS
ncbi:MAG: cyclic nucleotide-binding domain-containing protein [Spirochaetes bacterium]|nr:cyclic nucleotide-binding domain-containing protein [Spirochaetota bacterium]